MKPLSLCVFLDTKLSLSACCKVRLLVDVVNQAINVSISAAEKLILFLISTKSTFVASVLYRQFQKWNVFTIWTKGFYFFLVKNDLMPPPPLDNIFTCSLSLSLFLLTWRNLWYTAVKLLHRNLRQGSLRQLQCTTVQSRAGRHSVHLCCHHIQCCTFQADKRWLSDVHKP